MSSNSGVGEALAAPVRLLQYRDMANCAERTNSATAADGDARGRQGSSEAQEPLKYSASELEVRVAKAKVETEIEVEKRLRTEYEIKLQAARAPIARMAEEFEAQKGTYFGRIEAEVIQLSLAIARKILHREAQVDPMLVAALVRIALEKMREGSSVTIRVGPGCGSNWRAYFAGVPSLTEVEVVEDTHLTDLDCVVDTELGSANFGLDAQMKEVEQGFFDLLALRPAGQ